MRWQKPELVSATFPNSRWRKYMQEEIRSKSSPNQARYCRYLCNSWNAEHTGPEALLSLRVFFMMEPTGKPGEPPADIRRTRVITWRCDE